MKRSEMINVLDKAINSQLYLDCLFDEDMLNSVLIAIEQEGMFYCPKPKDGGNFRIPVGWEPEDET
jgi:hypothetical protein